MAQSSLQLLMRHIRRTAERKHASPLTDLQLLDRFGAVRDEEAFTVLVRRHAGLVLAAYRRGLVNAADVEDAFQATFLVLIRKADTICRRQDLGCWLYRVVSRIAAQAGAAAERRRQVEEKWAVPPERPAPDPSWHEVRYWHVCAANSGFALIVEEQIVLESGQTKDLDDLRGMPAKDQP